MQLSVCLCSVCSFVCESTIIVVVVVVYFHRIFRPFPLNYKLVIFDAYKSMFTICLSYTQRHQHSHYASGNVYT